MPDYSKTIIYKLCCNDLSVTDFYIGHTTDLIKRLWHHKSRCNNKKDINYNMKLYQYIRENGGWDNFNIITVEQIECKNINEAKEREKYYIELLKPTLNCHIPNRSRKEYYDDNVAQLSVQKKEYRNNNKQKIAIKKKEYQQENKDIISEYRKKYYEEHKHELLQKNKEYWEQNVELLKEKRKIKIRCECCNIEILKYGLIRHQKSKRHQELVNKTS